MAVTAQNHGFALQGEAGQSFATPFGPACISHTCANDVWSKASSSLTGGRFRCNTTRKPPPARTIESFDQFVELMAGEGR
ncbi:carbamoyl phosphate synthase small subunit [Mycobacterium tuberculosis CAS/NITR204]|uniref:Carbamoyl phosphate synthase small subunit n=1 Tax=Mycobacterium tuberculosis CAS/NITR204 TaxID=1310114 RepID=R4MG10_MYCTX|nr:carbamoyl phosphate synthase small subunit [Mycobacterium tuberculosis CAS/NITR204]